MAEYNKPAELRLDGDVYYNFTTFKNEVEIYFLATETTKKSPDVQVARLMNLLGPEARKVVNSLEIGGKKSVKSVLDVLEKAIVPKRNEVMAHFKFFRRAQQVNETFDHWLRELRHLVSVCEFGEIEDRILRTQIVLGIADKELQEKLLRNDYNLDKSINFIRACEAGAQHRREIEDLKTGQIMLLYNRELCNFVY